MKRALFLFFSLGLLAGTAAAADPVLDVASPAERALMPLLASGNFIKARDAAEKILATDRDSFLATWALALIQHNEEGNHARALFHVKRAEQLLQQQHGLDPTWHKRLLEEEYYVVFEMNRNAEALAVLDRADALYGPHNAEKRIWPLFKLGRPDEAREIARKLAASDDLDDRTSGYNGMLSIEFEAHDRDASFRWAVEGVRATQEKSCTILRNTAGAAFVRFRFAEAEDYALRAPKAERDCPNAGYDQLAGLYLAQGEFQKALSAIETLKGERLEKRYRPHFALSRRMILADVLYALGKVEDAERMAAELYSMPERTGMTSGSVEAERFARSFRYWMTLDTRIVLDRERLSYAPRFTLPEPSAALRILTQWEIRRALIQLAAGADILVTLTRPNLGEINEWTAWRSGGLPRVLGTGVVKAAIEVGRERDEAYPEAAGYFDALAGEIAWLEGDHERASRLATSALARLPREEALLRWRTQAWNADALRRQGRLEEARPLYHEVLQKYPTALRVLDLALPASVSADDDELARATADRLRRSSRFAVAQDAPFKLRVSVADGLPTICLTDANGFQLGCGTAAKTEKKRDEEATATAALEAFHAAAFSPKVSLKQSDLSSLDGTPVRVGADEVLKGVLSP